MSFRHERFVKLAKVDQYQYSKKRPVKQAFRTDIAVGISYQAFRLSHI